MSLKQFMRQLLEDDQGQSTTEYILILSVVVMIALKFKTKFAASIDGLTADVTGKIDSGIKDGN